MPPEVERAEPLHNVAANGINPTQIHFRERAGKVMFCVGGATFVIGSLGVLVAAMVRSPEWANLCGQIAAGGGVLQIPPAMLGYLPDMGGTEFEKPTISS